MTTSLRAATQDDTAALAALKRRVERECYAHLGTPEALAIRLHRRCTAWYLLGRIAVGDELLVAERDGLAVGLASAAVGRGLHLHSAAVAVRGQGIGRALTQARLETGLRLGLRTVTASCLVGATQAERRLRALGLVEVGERTASTTFPGVGLSHWTGNLHTAWEHCRDQPLWRTDGCGPADRRAAPARAREAGPAAGVPRPVPHAS